MSLAPVVVYTYTRFDHFIQTIESLKKNHLAEQTVLYIVSDGPKCDDHKSIIQTIRNYTEDLRGFGEVVKIFRPTNLGIAKSPPLADKQILHDHGKLICMEDDNITSSNFLDYMNAGLKHFEGDETIYSICGYCPPVEFEQEKVEGDFWRYPWNISWGYGVWKKKHDRFHPLKNFYAHHKRDGLLARQNASGGLYVSDSLKRDYLGLKHFPDSVLCTEMFAAGMQSIIPTVSKIQNIGQDGSGQSTKMITDKYDVFLDTGVQRTFDFTRETPSASLYRSQARAFHNGGLATRIARTLGIYHQLSTLRERIITK